MKTDTTKTLSKFYKGLIISTLSLSTLFVGAFVFLQLSHTLNRDAVVMQNGKKIETLSMNDFLIVPGSSEEYTVDLVCRANGAYNIQLDFKGEKNSLSNYIETTISLNEYTYTENLSTLFESGLLTLFKTKLNKDDAQTLKIKYDFSSEINDNLCGIDIDFNVLIQIKHA